MIHAAQNIVQSADAIIARMYLSMFRERNAVIGLLFHALFRNDQEFKQNRIDPLQRTTVAQLRSVIEYYLDHDYQFISPDDLAAGLAPGRNYVQLTFDDGYFNNLLALPILQEYKVPATFFISTDNVRLNKCFWWDVHYRERSAAGATARQIYKEAVALKRLKTEQIETKLLQQFGTRALLPRGDIDRPMNPAELRALASSPRVFIGNHTANHAILTNYDDAGMRDQLTRAQRAITEMTGKTPTAIAYPNGTCDARVIQACRDIGLTLGYTTRPVKIDIAGSDLMNLGRFAPNAASPINTQSHTYRSDISIYRSLRTFYLQLFRSGISA